LTSVVLAVAYGVVGLTGESLHYLITDPSALWTDPGAVAATGYFHTHAPDHHRHFHRHSHPAHHHHHHVGHARASEVSQPGFDRYADAIAPSDTSHYEHACPVLVLLSTLKLGHADSTATPITLERSFAALGAAQSLPSLHSERAFQARAPPGADVA
jgi:hypothetical protein